jgi:2,5-diamino-6-(ribosylamino)-4(3H)-pyrimidinone 5'-phosphate reductase
MAPSIDGRIAGIGSLKALTVAYERTAKTFDADGWIIGRISMEPYAGKARIPRRKERGRIPRRDFIANARAESYAIAIDPSGKLTWRSNAIDEEHVITILTERVPDTYLAFLRSKRVSYLFGGKSEIDLKRVLAKLRSRFGIKRLLLEGGGTINGSFLADDLIDELSVLVAPVVDGANGTPTLFDTGSATSLRRKVRLISVKKLAGDIVWLRYRLH